MNKEERKKNSRRTVKIAGLWIVTLLFALSGCQGAKGTQDNPQSAAQQSQITEESTEAQGEETQGNENPSESEPEETVAESTQEASEPEEEKEPFVADRSEVFALISQMNVGWNLGNTFDSHGNRTLSAETYWGNPKTTQEMIDAVAAQGFNTIRIPVTWKDHVGPAPDYTIDEAWLARVGEVVDYCVADDLFVIIDTHHEPDGWLLPAEDKYEEVSLELTKIWTQIAQFFKDYDEKLLFEGMNEPRIKGSEQEWSGGTDAEKKVVNALNQDFVKAVRATGGKNTTRCLIICAYGNNGTAKSMKSIEIPEDNYIAVAVHLYIPYLFTYEPDGDIFEWDGSKKQSMALALRDIENCLIKKGVPAIITEFGAVHKTKEENGKTTDNEDEVIKWLTDYLRVTEQIGVPCIWWDNGIYDKSGEKFGIFDRRECSWYSQRIADTLVNLTNQPSAD